MEGENGCSNYYKQVFYLLNDDNSYKFFIIAKKKLILVCKYIGSMFTYEYWTMSRDHITQQEHKFIIHFNQLGHPL